MGRLTVGPLTAPLLIATMPIWNREIVVIDAQEISAPTGTKMEPSPIVTFWRIQYNPEPVSLCRTITAYHANAKLVTHFKFTTMIPICALHVCHHDKIGADEGFDV